MAERMPRHLYDLQLVAEHIDLLAFDERHVSGGDLLVRRADNPCPGGRFELLHATHMIVMVMGDQDIGQLPARMTVEPGADRRAVTRIDHRTFLTAGILQQPYVVVGKGGQSIYLQHVGGRQVSDKGAS